MNRFVNQACRCLLTTIVITAGAIDAMAAESITEDRSLRIPHKEPAQALEAFHILDGFRMELLAAEPLLADPVAGAYDERGRAWICEMSDYPYTDKSTDKKDAPRLTDEPLGKVRILEDTDGDGVFDRSTLFADELSWPTGIALYDGGAFVSATPEIWYLKDTDGDGRADVRRKVFGGFFKHNIQHVINNLSWGLDQKVYGAGSYNGGTISCPEHPKRKAITFGRNDFRFDPITLEFEVLSGGARYGNSFDDWGNRFLCNIRNPVQHVVLPARYLARNPYLPVASALQDVAEAGDTVPVFRTSAPEPWRVINASRLTGAGDLRMPKSEKNHGYFTSAAGATLYRGDAYPESFRHQVFIGEVANNLVHREQLEPKGVTFTSKRIDQNAEFITSEDNWFRPVNFINAPDGTLHVLDMYRETIEHPWSIPDDIKARLDLESGRDRGRMYRLVPPGFQPPKPPQLGKASTSELIGWLSSNNAWHRETAQRLIFQRNDRSAVEPLRKLLNSGNAQLGRLHAMWTLHALDALEEADLLVAMGDAASGIRRHAVLLAEPRLGEDGKLLDRVLTMAEDDEMVVRFQVAFTLGEADDKRAAGALTSIARRDAADPWMRAAVLSSTGPHADRMLRELIADTEFSAHTPGLELVRELAYVVGASSSSSKAFKIFTSLVDLPVVAGVEALRASVTLGLGEGAKRNKNDLGRMVDDAPQPVQEMFHNLIADAVRCAKDPVQSMPARLEAIRLIGIADFDTGHGPLCELLEPRFQIEIQMAALKALSNYRSEPQVADLLLDPARWSTYTPGLRVEVVDAVLSRPERIVKVLKAIAAGKVLPAQIRPARRDMLLAYSDKAIRDLANQVLGAEKISLRADVITQYKSALELHGDMTRGEQVFLRECAACHRLGDRGHNVGPNLATILHRSADQLLINILDPNREVPPNFVQYTAVLDDGRIATGIIDSETPTSITLKRGENVQETILRQNVEQLSSTGMSLMPEGIEKKVDPQGIADLLEFLLKNK